MSSHDPETEVAFPIAYTKPAAFTDHAAMPTMFATREIGQSARRVIRVAREVIAKSSRYTLELFYKPDKMGVHRVASRGHCRDFISILARTIP